MPARRPRRGGWPRRSAPARPARGGVSATSASANAVGIGVAEHRVVRALEPDRARPGCRTGRGRTPSRRSGSGSTTTWSGSSSSRRSEACRSRAWPCGVAGDVQVGAADVADQQRVAGEHQPRLVGAAAPVGHRVGVMGGRVARAWRSPSRACCRARPPRRPRARRARTRRQRRPEDTPSRRCARRARAGPRRGRPARASRTPRRSATRPRRPPRGSASTRSTCGSTTASIPWVVQPNR